MKQKGGVGVSFASQTKKALCEIRVKKKCCREALLFGILRAAYVFCDREIRFTTRSRQTALLTASLLDEFFGIRLCLPFDDTADTAEIENESAENCQILLLDDDARAVAACFGEDTNGRPDAFPLMLADGGCASCRNAFVRGVFLSCGNVTDPSAYYHLDLVLSEDILAEKFSTLLCEMGLPPKHTARKGLPVLYYKGSESIEDFLGMIGANRAVFSVMDAKILKDLRNNANRISNCELANLGKTVGAATVQYEAIRGLIEDGRFSLLSAELRQTAQLRYDHPDLPLKELAALHHPPLTKSGINHRLRRIVEFTKCVETDAEESSAKITEEKK